MITSDDMLFWTKIELSETDVIRYEEAVLPEFQSLGGTSLPLATQKQALCYLIASKILNSQDGGFKTSESLGGYSYSRNASTYSNRWLDLFYEVLKSVGRGIEYAHGGLVERTDLNVVQLNRRYGNGGIF